MKINEKEPLIKNSIKFYDDKINVFGNGDYDSIENPKNRFSLELEIEKPKGNKSLITIMMNPSETFPKCIKRESQIDPTVQNIIKIAYQCKYNKIYVKNIFPLINPKSSFPYKKDEFYYLNKKKIIESLTKNNYDTLIAWGTKIKKEDIVDFLTLKQENIKILDCLKNRNLFVWKLSKKNKPMHPSPLNRHISKFLQQPNPKLIPIKIKIDDNGNISVC